WWLVVIRVVFGLIAVAALGLGWYGLSQFVTPDGLDTLHRNLNLAYYDLQLFVLSSHPLDDPGPYPWALDVARFAAPAATVYALGEAAWAVFGTGWQRWLHRHTGGHAIVVGSTTEARAIAAALGRGRQRVLQTPAGDAAS